MSQIIKSFSGFTDDIKRDMQTYISSGYKVVAMGSPLRAQMIVVFEKEDDKR